MFFCHPTVSVKALNQTQSINYQPLSSPHPFFIHSRTSEGWALLSLSRLSIARPLQHQHTKEFMMDCIIFISCSACFYLQWQSVGIFKVVSYFHPLMLICCSSTAVMSYGWSSLTLDQTHLSMLVRKFNLALTTGVTMIVAGLTTRTGLDEYLWVFEKNLWWLSFKFFLLIIFLHVPHTCCCNVH